MRSERDRRSPSFSSMEGQKLEKTFVQKEVLPEVESAISSEVGVALKKTLLLKTYTRELPLGDQVAYMRGSGGGPPPGGPPGGPPGPPGPLGKSSGGPPSWKLGGANFFKRLNGGARFVRTPEEGQY